MRILRVESDAVVKGDQLVGALADLGVNPSSFEWEFSKLDAGDFHMHFERPKEEAGEAGVAFSIHPGATHQEYRHGHEDLERHHAHAHAHPEDLHESDDRGSGHGHEHQRASEDGVENGPTPLPSSLNLSALRRLVENGELPGRAKELSLGLLANLEGLHPVNTGVGTDRNSMALSESELSLLAQVVLVAIGLDQLKIDQVEVVPATKRNRALPETGTGGPEVPLDPVVAAVLSLLPRTDESPVHVQKAQSGVGLSASAHAPAWARIEASILEG